MLFWPSDSLYPVYSTVGNQVAVMKAGAVVIKDESENIVAKELLHDVAFCLCTINMRFSLVNGREILG